MVPLQLRVGGAFLGVALVLVLYAVLALLRGDATFPITPQVLSVIAAVAIVGAFATSTLTKQVPAPRWARCWRRWCSSGSASSRRTPG